MKDEKQLPGGITMYSSSYMANKTKEYIEELRRGQTGFICRWYNINRLLSKYWRPGSYVIAGNSGSGKSYFLKMLLDDFALINALKIGNTIIPAMNDKYIYKDKTIFIHFGLEMKTEDEMIRSLSSMLDISFSTAIECEYDVKASLENGVDTYNTLTDKNKRKMNFIIDSVLAKQNIRYINTPMTIDTLIDIIDYIHLHKDCRIVVTYDHALLTKTDPNSKNSSTIDLAGKLGNSIRDLCNKYGDLFIVLNQMNTDIQKPERKRSPNNHYPIINDGYGGNQLYFAVDNYIFFNKPSQYGLEEYGINKYPTLLLITEGIIKLYPTIFIAKDLNQIMEVIHFYPLKPRLQAGNKDAWLLNALYRGQLLPCPVDLLEN